MKKIFLSLMMFIFMSIGYASEKKPLIIYFSYSGNTKLVAETIQKNTNGNIFRIETTKPYPESYHETTKIVQDEFNNKIYPELKFTTINNLEEYDTIFIGYPIWWDTMPMAVQVFLKANDFSEKTIIPFCTHGGSRFGSSLSDLKELIPNSQIKEGFETSNAHSPRTETEIKTWLDKII